MRNINDIEKRNYGTFYSMNGLVKGMVRNPKVWSWGAHNWMNQSDLLLRFTVNGNLFKGYIFIGVNGKDLFDCYLVNTNGFIKEEVYDIFIEDLIEMIDERVEKIKNYKW